MTVTASWISKKPDRCGGDAFVRDTRIIVWGLVAYRRLGMSDAEIMLASGGALDAARGQKVGAELLAAEGPPLSPQEVGKLLQIPLQEVERMRQAGRLLVVESAKQGYLFPSWQIAEHRLLPGIEEVLADLGAISPWAQFQFFLNSNLRLDGASPLEE
jgi:hypothetical protein